MWPFARLFRASRTKAFEASLDPIADALHGRRFDEAIAHAEASIALGVRAHGDGHAALRAPLYALGSAALSLGRLDEARAALDRALASRRDEDPPTPPDAQILEMLVSVEEKRADASAAADTFVALVRRWLEACERESAPADRRARAENVLGVALARGNDLTGARAAFQRALALRSEVFGEGHVTVLETLYNLATHRDPEGDPDDAVRDYETVIARARLSDVESARTLLASAEHNLGALLVAQERYDDASPHLEAALSLREERLGKDAPALRPTLTLLARAAEETGKSLLAVSLYDRAIALAEKSLDDEDPILLALRAARRGLVG